LVYNFIPAASQDANQPWPILLLVFGIYFDDTNDAGSIALSAVEVTSSPEYNGTTTIRWASPDGTLELEVANDPNHRWYVRQRLGGGLITTAPLVPPSLETVGA
jgi:hypothetical protein